MPKMQTGGRKEMKTSIAINTTTNKSYCNVCGTYTKGDYERKKNWCDNENHVRYLKLNKRKGQKK